MKRTTLLAIVLGLAVWTGCGQPSGSTAALQPSSSAATAGSASPSAAATHQLALAEDLTFTGQLSGHVSTATATGDCGVKSDGTRRTFQATIVLVLADGTHGFRVIWPNYQGPPDLPVTIPPSISISPAGAPDQLNTADTYHAPTAKVTVATDERSGTVDGDYIKGPTLPPGGLPGVAPPASQGHVSGTWRCA